MQVRRVYFSEGDGAGWAIDEDLRLVRGALEGRFEPSSLMRSEIVHAVWWQKLLPFSRGELRGKHVLCNADNAPFYYATEPEFLKVREQVTLWIARSQEGVSQFSSLGLECRFAPYTYDPAVFHPLPPEDPKIRALIEKWRIPEDRYLIANFHRDTEGGDLMSPKLQKGPDAFLEIVARLRDEGAPVHVLLAGPRRFWVRRALEERGVPFTFVGEDTDGRDDYGVNILPRPLLNLLYNIADLHLITSRWEGGPQSALESAATRSKVISTRVGLAPDVLAPECLFSDIPEACEIVKRDIDDNRLATHTEAQFTRVLKNHTEDALRRHLAEIYETLPRVGTPPVGRLRSLSASFRRAAREVATRFRPPSKSLRIAMLHRPPTGGSAPLGSMFENLAAQIGKQGHNVIRTRLDAGMDGVLLGAVAEDDPLLSMLRKQKTIPVIGFFDEAGGATEDALFAQMARHSARNTCTVLPSFDALDALRKSGLLPARVIVLPPLPGTLEDERDRSGNRDEGGATPANLAGRTARNAIPTVRDELPLGSSDPLVIETGDQWAANRIATALESGRAVVYPSTSHYRNLVWFGGAAYAGPEEARQKLDSIRANCSMFARMTLKTNASQIAERIVSLLKVCRNLMADEG